MSHGRLEVIYGPMFSGKSSTLIRRLESAVSSGVRTLAMKSHLDDRHDYAHLSSHDGLRFPCHAVERSRDIPALIGDARVLGIDEAQFLGDELVPVVRLLRDAGLRLVVAGLHEDYRGSAFEPIPTLISEADEATFLTAICANCGAPAVHTHRTACASARVVVGARESYEPRCSRCFRPPSAST